MNHFFSNKPISSNIIILFFTLSIFFWGLEIFIFEVRFSYLLTIIFFNRFFFDKLPIIFSLFIIIHSFFLNHYLGISFNHAYFLQLIIIVLTSFTVYKNFNLILSNIKVLIFYFSIILLLLIFYDLVMNILNRSVISLNCIFGCFSINKFIFDENSHFAISVIPALIYLSLSKNNYINFVLITILLLFSFFNFSTTLFVGLVLLSIIFLIFEWKKSTFKQKKNIFILLLFSILISIVNINDDNTHKSPIVHRFHALFDLKIYAIKSLNKKDNEKKIEKVKIKNNNKTEDINYNIDPNLPNNLSTDVVLKSLKISVLSILKYPLGVGLNNYDFAHKEFINSIKTKYPLTKTFNIQDGSNNFIKILTEFGIFSIFFAYVILKFFFQKNHSLELKYFLLSFIFLEVFIRGAGYFNGGFLIVFLLIYLSTYKKN